MYTCDVVFNNRAYIVTVSTNETIIGVIEKDIGVWHLGKATCTVYNGDRTKVCNDIFITKRIRNVVYEYIKNYERRQHTMKT